MAHLSEAQHREIVRLKAQVEELMHINSEWDKEYRELKEAFRRYQADSQQAQSENHTIVARLKEKVSALEEETARLEDELVRYQRELHVLREKLALSESVKTGGAVGEELALLRQQVNAYQEDFEAEKRDKERLRDEKESSAIRHEAEKTSLQLQLDRYRNDLAHFTSEANRLAQQLKLKSEYEEESFRQHLESKGFVPRSPSYLPPLDPYVEIDQNVPIGPPSTDRVHGRNHEMVMHSGLIIHNGHDHSLPNRARTAVNGGSVSPIRRRSNNSSPNSCRLVPRGVDKEELCSAPTVVNSATVANPPTPPPLSTRGKHVCPRCARRFQEKTIFQQHKDRCLA